MSVFIWGGSVHRDHVFVLFFCVGADDLCFRNGSYFRIEIGSSTAIQVCLVQVPMLVLVDLIYVSILGLVYLTCTVSGNEFTHVLSLMCCQTLSDTVL